MTISKNTQPVQQQTEPKQTAPTIQKTVRPAVQKQGGLSPVYDYSTSKVYNDAKDFYNSGNTAMGNKVLSDYYTQMGNKNSPYYRAQYTTWDAVNGDEQKTLDAESDLLSMYNAVNDAVGKGYSDSWIKNNISTKNYPGLASLTNDTVLTRQIQYLGDDTINGMIFAARNPDDEVSKDLFKSSIAYSWGEGVKYRASYKSEAAKDPNSEIYHPYMQGNHAEGKEAEDNTVAVKQELDSLKKACRAKLEAGQTADEVYEQYFGNNMRGLDWGVDGEPAYVNLYAMEYARQNKSAIPLTEDVDFAAPYFKQWLYDQADEIGVQRGEADAAVTRAVIERQSAAFNENIPPEYQEAVLELYAQDMGYTREEDVTPQSYAGLEGWLKEHGLIGSEDFRTAFNSTVAELSTKWDNEVQPSAEFIPADFMSDGNVDDKEVNDKQVAFRIGMKNFLAGRPTANADAKAFTQRYGFLFSNVEVNPGDIARGSRASVPVERVNKLSPAIDAALDKLDSARNRGEISDEEYFNLYLDVAASYDNYGEWNKAQPKGYRAPQNPYSKYVSTVYGEDGQTLETGIVNRIEESIAAGKIEYDERMAADRAEVGKAFGEFERADVTGQGVNTPIFNEIRNVQINNNLDIEGNAADAEYVGLRNKYTTMPIPDLSEYGEHYDYEYYTLAGYDTAERVNDIMRFAQHYNISFTEARQAMGFETEQDLRDWLDECNRTTQKECASIVDATYDVFNQLVGMDKGTTAEDLLKQGKIDQETFDKFRGGMGNNEYEDRFYSVVDDTRERGTGGRNTGAAAGARVYKDAMRERNPQPGEAHGYSSNVWDVVRYGAQNGRITHKNAWVMAVLGYAEMSAADRENKARLDYNNDGIKYRRVIEQAIQGVDDPELREAYMSQLNLYNGDIFKFDFDTNKTVVALNNANRRLAAEKQALDEEAMGLLTPSAYNWYNTVGTATNSTLLSVEAIIVSNVLGAMGASKAGAALMGQMLTTAPVEGGQATHELKMAGVDTGTANAAGALIGIATALSEFALEGLVQKAMYKTPWTRSIENFGRINTAANMMKVADFMTARGAGQTTAKLMSWSAGSVMGFLNIGRNVLVSSAGNALQEVQQDLTADLIKAGVGGKQFLGTIDDYTNTFVETMKSGALQMISPVSLVPSMTKASRTAALQNNFAQTTRQTATEIAARGQSEVGTLQMEAAQAEAELNAATADRQAAMDKLNELNLQALVEQETAKRLAPMMAAIHENETSQRINELNAGNEDLNSRIDDYNNQREAAAARTEETQARIDAGDISKETLDFLNDSTGILRMLDRNIADTQSAISRNNEELTKLKAEKKAQREQAKATAQQQATEAVMTEAAQAEAEKAKAAVEQAKSIEENAKAKHEAAKSRVQTALEAYQKEMADFRTETRAAVDDVNSVSEGTLINDGLVDIALGISNELFDIDVKEMGKREATIKQSLVKQLELSFPGYKVEMRPMGRGNHGRVAIDGGNGIIILNSDSTSYELMNGELGYELGKMAQIDKENYKALYDAVTTAVYGGAAGTQAAYNEALAQAVADGASTDVMRPDNAIDRANSEVFANAFGRLLSGEFMEKAWVQNFASKAPELAGDVFDWVALRAKEFKTIARHGNKETKAQYNVFVNILKSLGESLDRAKTIDLNGQEVDVDMTPVAVEEDTTQDASAFMDGLVHDKHTRYTGEKRLPLFEKQADGSYTIDRNQLSNEENALINDVIEAGKQDEYNALNGEVSAETVTRELEEAAGVQPKAETVAEEQVTPVDAAERDAEQPTARDALVDGLRDTLSNIGQYDEETQRTMLGRIRGIIHNVFNGNRDRSSGEAMNTPLAIIKAMMDNTGATLYQNAKKGSMPATAYSRPGYIASKRLLVRDMNAYIRAEGDHVMDVIQNDVANNGLTTTLTQNTPQENIDMFNEWMLRGISGLNNRFQYTAAQLADFGSKLHLALVNNKEGLRMFNALEEAHNKLKAYYDAEAINKARAYVVETAESRKVDGVNWFTKFKAYWTGADVYGDIFDKMTNYATAVRKNMRYNPYGRGISNMWIGDSDTTHGFVDLDHNTVPGASTLHDGIRDAFANDTKFFEQNKDKIWDDLNVLLALQSALDRIEHGNNPFTEMSNRAVSEAAKFLGINGHPTEQSIREAIRELSQDNRLVQAANNVRTWWDNIMQLALTEGMLSQETYDKFKLENPMYAPLQRDMSTISKKGRHTSGSTNTSQGDLVATSTGISFRKAKGHSDRAILNPLQSFAEMAQVMGDKLTANRTAQEFAKAYDLAPYDTVGIFAGEISNGQARVLAKKQGGADVLNVYYGDGTHRSFMVNNQELLDLLQGKRPGDNTVWLTRQIGKFTRMMASLTTTNNPFFALRNAIRDYQTSVNYGSWASNYVSGLPKWIAAFAECLRYTHSKMYNELVNDTNEGAASQQLADFLQRGGEGFMRKEMTRKHTENARSAIMGDKFAVRALGAGKSLITFNTLNDAVEMASRYVEYKYGKNETDDTKGATDQSKFNAFMASRDVTVDFAQSGYGRWAQVARQVIPFFNATLQGWYRTFRGFSAAEQGNRATRFAKTFTNNVIMGALSAGMCLFGGHVFGGDDDDWDEQASEYLKLTDDMKEGFILMPLSGFGFIGAKDFIRVPLLQDGLGKLCYNIGRDSIETVARRMRGEDVTVGDVAMDMLGVTWEIFSEPFTRDNIIIPAIDVMRNTTYYGSDLVNKSKMTYEAPDQWGSASTPNIFFKMSGGVRSLLESLGVKDPQWMQLLTSPAGLEYLTKEYTGVFGQLVIPALSRDKYTGKETGLWAGIGRTVVNSFTLDAESTNDISSNFKDSVDYLNQIANLSEDKKGIKPLSTMLTSDERLEAKAEAVDLMGKEIKDIQDAVKDKWREYNEIMSNDSLDEKEKQKAAEEVRKEINTLEQQGVDIVNSYKLRWGADLSIFGKFADGWRSAQQTLLDEGPGLNRAEPAEPTAANPSNLQTVLAGMPSAGDLTQTLPYEEEESENVQAPLTSPNYTGERVRGVTAEYTSPEIEAQRRAEAYRNGRNVFTETNRTPNRIPAEAYNARAAKREYHLEQEAQRATANYEYTPNPNSRVDRSRIDLSEVSRSTAPVQATQQAAPTTNSTYKLSGRVQNVGAVYGIERKKGDTWTQRQIQSLYGDSLPESYYSELAGYMKADRKAGATLIATPATEFTMDGDTYELKNYPGADAAVLDWFGDAYVEGYNRLVNDPVYQNGTAEDRLKMFKQLRTDANAVAKKQFVLNYVSANTRGLANDLDERTLDVAMHLSKEYSARTNEQYVRDVYGNNLPASWYEEFNTAWNMEKDTALLPFPSASVKVGNTTHYLTDYDGAQKDVANWYFDKYLLEYDKLTQTSEYRYGTQESRASMLAKLDSKANSYAMTNFKVKYLNILD